MIVTADWVLPVAGPPIRDGALLISGSRIAEVGPRDFLIEKHPRAQVHPFEGCTIVPGLVNAHTHLALTALRGVVPSQPFHDWIKQIPKAYGALSPDDIAASTTHGAIQCILAGVTVVGDITYGPEGISIAADTGLGGTFYWEILGTTGDKLQRRLAAMEYPTDPEALCTGRLRCGLSPHAVYTSGPELLRATHAVATAQRSSFAIHAAESDAEIEVLRSGEGPLRDLAGRLADGFEATGAGVVGYLDGLGVLTDAVLIHGNRILPSEIPAVSRKARGVVLCPRSNAYLHNAKAPAKRLRDGGVLLALGTDSAASNENLDLLAEARALREIEPSFTAEDLLRMVTLSGACVLGLDEEFGTLEPGKQADLVVHRLPGVDPVGELIDRGGRSTVEAVMTGGVFRVLDGGPVFAVSPIERASHLARQKAALAVLSENDRWT